MSNQYSQYTYDLSRFLFLAEKIRQDIESLSGSPVFIRALPKSNQISFDKRKTYPKDMFAHIKPRKRDSLCRIASKAEWSIKAGAGDSKDRMLQKGWYNTDDEYYWDIKAIGDSRYQEVIIALSKICQVR